MSYESNKEKNTDDDRKTDTLSCGGVAGYFKTVENLRIKEIYKKRQRSKEYVHSSGLECHTLTRGAKPNPQEGAAGLPYRASS